MMVVAASLALAAASHASAAPGSSSAPIARSADGTIVVEHLPERWLTPLVEEEATAKLRPAGTNGGMDAAVRTSAIDAVTLAPRFPLMEGIAYELVLEHDSEPGASVGRLTLDVVGTAESIGPAARVTDVWPSAGTVPENTLRLYLHFSAPMARGRVREHVHLESSDGTRLDDSFLNLATELWSADQRRLTMLLDPGRIKRGVGPNEKAGPPLSMDRSYRLVVSRAARDASGRPIAEDHVHAFDVGPPIRTAVDARAWTLDVPRAGSRRTLKIDFDRLMDRAIASRALIVVDADGTPVPGTTTADARTWSFTPNAPWTTGTALRVEAVLEDVAGNTLCHPFDVGEGGGTVCREPVFLPLEPS